ncbi:hypothetical protein ACIBCN_17225 [Nocardia sp. NPDC051052]|uniref:hypothetical protein n=1 Tax=Nocardia sp. NPDC051052 TaxID=3364322 RepID=UPI0037973EDF
MRAPDNNEPDNNEPDNNDPDATKVIVIPVDAFDGEHGPDETNTADGPDDLADEVADADDSDEDEGLDEEVVSPLVRRWRRVTDYVTTGDVRRHLPYAAAAAVAIIAVITVVIATGTGPKKTDEVTDTASSSDTSSGTQSFDDITQLLQGGLANTTTPLETSFPTTVSETPSDVPPPGDIPSVEPEGIDQSITPATVAVTDSAPIENVSGDPVSTETSVTTETVAPSTITETPTAGPGPGFSIDGSISVQASRQPSTAVPGGPSTVTVVVPAGTTPPQPSTVTVIVPATTTPQQPKPSASKPTGCPTTTTPSKTKTTTPSLTTSTRAQATTTPTRATTPAPTSKKPTTTTTTAQPCK